MKAENRVLTQEMAQEWLIPLLEQGQPVPLTITGSSMFPFLHHGRDSVYLMKHTADLRVGDLVFYRRSGGQFVLHRIISVGETYTLLGDRQVCPEPGICREQILAVATAVRRNGKVLRPGAVMWEFFRGPWQWLRPLRPWLIRGYILLTGRKMEQ